MRPNWETDVMVLGGGPAGLAAAVAASRQGLRVVLVDRNPFLGGTATAAEVGTICGLYAFSRQLPPVYIAGRFAIEFAERIQSKSETAPIYHPPGLHFLPYRVDVFKKLCADLMEENGISVFLQAELYNLKLGDNAFESVAINQFGEPLQIRFGSIVDCSGYGLLSQLANLTLIQSDQYQAAAQVFTLTQVSENNEARLGLLLMKALRHSIGEGKLAEHFDRVYIVPGSLQNGCVSIKVGIPIAVTHGAENRAALERSALSMVQELTEFLIQEVSPFQQAKLAHMAPQVGIRVGQRMKGHYLLTEQDVLQGRKFPDGIARSAWPIEEWEQDRRVKMAYLTEGDHYQIPARSLQSVEISNLFAAGRCLSATDRAIASARVMGTCLQTGYAAGRLAAACARQQGMDKAVSGILEEQF